MRLICPGCGAMASAEAWGNDAAARQFIDGLTRLSGPVQLRVLPYLGLFRQGGRGLTWSRAQKLLDGLAQLTLTGMVQWEGGEERPAPPMLWAEALDAVLARRPKALTNHNYLRHVAWEMAVGAAGQVEREREDKKRRTEDGGRMTEDRGAGEKPGMDGEEDREDVRGLLKELTGKLAAKFEG